jgi:HEAT repeat protein
VNDPDADVRVAVCEIWGRRGDAEAAKILAGVLSGDIDRDVRLAAARALGTSRDQIAVTALGTALDDNDPAMQYRAVASLRESTGQDLGNDVNRWREYAKNGTLKPGQPTSLADRVRRVF